METYPDVILFTLHKQFVLQVSANGPSRLVPACPPLPTSGLTYIRLHLPVPKVVNCVLIRLYKPRDANSIGLLQIRLLGTHAFGGSMSQNNENDDELHCKHSLGKNIIDTIKKIPCNVYHVRNLRKDSFIKATSRVLRHRSRL